MRIKIIAAIVLLTNFIGIEQTSYAIPAEPAQTNNKQAEAKEPLDAIEKKAPEVLFFTTYNAGAIDQNDDDPCTSASGIDICTGIANGKKYIALTRDMRDKMGIQYWDKVRLTGKNCPGVYIVADEMNKRYRGENCVKKAGYCKKGDIAVPRHSKQLCDGVYEVEKI